VTGVSGADGAGTAGDHDSEVAGLEMLTRALVGITLQSLEVLGGEVSLPQFRLLLAASTLGRVPSSRPSGEITLNQLLRARREDLREEEQRARLLLRLVLLPSPLTRQGRSARRKQTRETGRTPEKPAS
jgi:hypothetical protein